MYNLLDERMSADKRIIYAEKDENFFSYFYRQTQRSNFYIEEVTHCFEATYVGGCEGFEFGFTPSNYVRTFVILWYPSAPYVAEKFNENDYTYKLDITPVINEAVMVCLNSTNSTFSVIINNEMRSFQYSYIKDSRRWYAMIDAGSSCQNTLVNVTVNLGRKQFVNKIPNGYSPFINGFIDELVSLKNKLKSCKSEKKFTRSSFINLI